MSAELEMEKRIQARRNNLEVRQEKRGLKTLEV